MIPNTQIDRLLQGTKIGGRNRNTPSLAAARDYLTGRCRTVQQAADLHGARHNVVSRIVHQIEQLAAQDATRASCVQVGVLIGPEHVDALTAWVDDRGGEVMP